MSLSLSIEPETESFAGRSRPPESEKERAMLPPAVASRAERFDAAVSEMQAYLDRFNPESDAEALQSLRKAFPSSPLSDRIAAIRARLLS
jgi:hypothetical protein